MTTSTMSNFMGATLTSKALKRNRIESIDLLRGIIMVIMALDHVRDYFHRDAFLYSPTDLTQTSVFLFFTRWITHFCAPIFIFLAGISAYLYGSKRNRHELELYLFTRGIWLVIVELFIISFGLTFNPTYPMFNLQVIWAIGISMMVLSVLINMPRNMILLTGLLLIAGHNLLDGIHRPGNGMLSFLWAFVHEPNSFIFGRFQIFVHYPVVPWIGVMAVGYYIGGLYDKCYNSAQRKKILLAIGTGTVALFIILRFANIYGDAAHWSRQPSAIFTVLSFFNVTKYPPSLLYILMTLGPAMIFLAFAEGPLNALTGKLVIFGRTPFFYYVLHLYLIHFLALIGASVSGYNWTDLVLTSRVNSSAELKGYGFGLPVVYAVWSGLIIALYPCCKWFDNYKRLHQSKQRWLTYV